MSELAVTARTRHSRLRDQGSVERADLVAILRAGFVCHLGLIIDGYPMVLPTVFGIDPDVTTLYLHGSVASRSLLENPEATVCVTVTHVDGLVLARSVFEHGVNYRSAMVFGSPRLPHLLVQSEIETFALEPDGTVGWRIAHSDVVTDAVLVGGRLVLTSFGGQVSAVDPLTGRATDG